MKKVAFTQDIGVERAMIQSLLDKEGLMADWSMADGIDVEKVDNIIAISTAHIPLTKERLSQFPNLKVVSMSFTGYDHVDKEFCKQKNISVYNVPSYSTDSVAELAIGLCICLLRQIPLGNSEVENGNWNENLIGFELANKKCGIIGTGTIGCRLAEILKVFKCQVQGWSRTERDVFKEQGGLYCSLDEIFKNSDLIFITTALNENTKDLISFNQFDLMKKSSYIINIARGPILNKSALIDAIKRGKVAGAALDVYDIEPLDREDELRTLQNLLLTPHIAYRTKEALNRKALVTVENIFHGLNGNPENRVI